MSSGLSARSRRGDHLLRVVNSRGERLLDEDTGPGGERRLGWLAVVILHGGNDQSVRCRSLEQFVPHSCRHRHQAPRLHRAATSWFRSAIPTSSARGCARTIPAYVRPMYPAPTTPIRTCSTCSSRALVPAFYNPRQPRWTIR